MMDKIGKDSEKFFCKVDCHSNGLDWLELNSPFGWQTNPELIYSVDNDIISISRHPTTHYSNVPHPNPKTSIQIHYDLTSGQFSLHLAHKDMIKYSIKSQCIGCAAATTTDTPSCFYPPFMDVNWYIEPFSGNNMEKTFYINKDMIYGWVSILDYEKIAAYSQGQKAVLQYWLLLVFSCPFHT